MLEDTNSLDTAQIFFLFKAQKEEINIWATSWENLLIPPTLLIE